MSPWKLRGRQRYWSRFPRRPCAASMSPAVARRVGHIADIAPWHGEKNAPPSEQRRRAPRLLGLDLRRADHLAPALDLARQQRRELFRATRLRSHSKRL